jgi:hypothetical protein
MACPVAPPASRGAVPVTTKLQVWKVGMVTLGGACSPAILLVETVKVQDPKATVPVAVEFPLVSVKGAEFVAVDGAPKVKLTGVLARPELKSDPFEMVNVCPTTACTVVALAGTGTLDTVLVVGVFSPLVGVSSPPPPPQPNIANVLTSAHTTMR